MESSIQSAQTRPGADCGSDQELLIAKFRLTLKKVRKTTRPLRYDLNLYAGQEATVRTGHGKIDWFQIGKAVCQLSIVTLLI